MNEKGLLKNKLGGLLIEAGIISAEDLETLLSKQLGTGKRLGQVAVDEGFATEEQIVKALAKQLKIPFISLGTTVIDPEVVRLVTEPMARDLTAIPLFRVEKTITVAMADPTDSETLKEIRFVTGCEVEPVIARPEEIRAAIDMYYGQDDNVIEELEDLPTGELDAAEEAEENDQIDGERLSQEAPVVKITNLIIERAIGKGASDIHVEPGDTSLSIRYRVDGVLHEELVIPRMLKAAVVSRLKILARINIAERRIPQDGRFTVRVAGRKIDLRVSTFPTVHGEKVVMRILERSATTIALEELGMNEDILRQFGQVVGLTHGIVLVTGPTGSGKTTTLYAALNKVNDTEKNIVTLEDPVESQIPGINQGHTNPVAGFTFASGLRSLLRQDPDIIMVGETRDAETAEIAIQAALTGHLVFTTVHTNDAISSVVRLIDMGIEPFLVASSVGAMLAQRLVRKVCRECATQSPPVDIFIPETGQVRKIEAPLHAVGCDACEGTGYKGRTGLYELVVMNDKMKRLIVSRAPMQDLVEKARDTGYRTMFEDGVDKVAAGITSLEEVMRVTRTVLEDDIYSMQAVASMKK
ncbi:MAG: GspE/PulE family protein [Candidatus Eisenbacteria bacterium]